MKAEQKCDTKAREKRKKEKKQTHVKRYPDKINAMTVGVKIKKKKKKVG